MAAVIGMAGVVMAAAGLRAMIGVVAVRRVRGTLLVAGRGGCSSASTP
ncbi:hypothetical protein KAE78_01685 [Microbacterium sp. NIBRBAC000506063]|nr:hypothetical protein [Microbacterium sp. NIBRBAC000506063]QTV79922.1 hypothetical protein KAE78_01685 [Microbacterium sp. NIBRBAC000506063]